MDFADVLKYIEENKQEYFDKYVKGIMSEKEFDDIWKPVSSVCDTLDYDRAVVIGSSFGKLKVKILEMQEKIKYLEERDEELSKLEAYGVDNWSGYCEAMSDSEGYFGEE